MLFGKNKEIDALKFEIVNLKSSIDNLKEKSKELDNSLSQLKDYMIQYGRKKTVNGEKVSDFELFLKDKK